MKRVVRPGLLLGVALTTGIVGFESSALALSTGITTPLLGAAGCNACHAGGTPPVVRLLGPGSVAPSSITEYTLEIDAVGMQDLGGLNVQVDAGQLQVGGNNATNTQLVVQEITHTGPKAAEGGTVRFSFLWEAPAAPGMATLTAWGNAVDGNGLPSNDSATVSPKELDVTVQALPSGLDAYKCYQGTDLQNPAFLKLGCPAGVQTSDQFGSECVDLQKVKFVCAPVSVDGSALVDSSTHLICYQIKGAAFDPRPSVEVNTQFQTSRFELKKPKLLCVPGTKVVLP